MHARHLTIALMLLVLAAPAFAQTDDLQVFRDVQQQVLRYPHFTIFDNINAQVSDGVLTLTGQVTMPYKREAIEARVRRVAGVDEVHNRIEVLPASQFDDRLRYSIARAIYGHPALSNYRLGVNPPIHIIVNRGRVTLEGVVNSHADRLLARAIATSFLAFDVQNELKTDAEVKAALEQL